MYYKLLKCIPYPPLPTRITSSLPTHIYSSLPTQNTLTLLAHIPSSFLFFQYSQLHPYPPLPTRITSSLPTNISSSLPTFSASPPALIQCWYLVHHFTSPPITPTPPPHQSQSPHPTLSLRHPSLTSPLISLPQNPRRLYNISPLLSPPPRQEISPSSLPTSPHMSPPYLSLPPL